MSRLGRFHVTTTTDGQTDYFRPCACAWGNCMQHIYLTLIECVISYHTKIKVGMELSAQTRRSGNQDEKISRYPHMYIYYEVCDYLKTDVAWDVYSEVFIPDLLVSLLFSA